MLVDIIAFFPFELIFVPFFQNCKITYKNTKPILQQQECHGTRNQTGLFFSFFHSRKRTQKIQTSHFFKVTMYFLLQCKAGVLCSHARKETSSPPPGIRTLSLRRPHTAPSFIVTAALGPNAYVASNVHICMQRYPSCSCFLFQKSHFP